MNYFIGQKASMEKTYTKQDVEMFSAISLDNNPVHLDADYASTTIFKKPICHGFLVGSLISAVIASKLPGPGTIYLSQHLDFKKPVFFDDTIVAEVEIVDIKEEKRILFLKTTCINQNQDLVIDGSAVVMVDKM